MQPPQPQLEQSDDDEEDSGGRFPGRVVAYNDEGAVPTWTTDWGNAWDDRFSDEPMGSFEGGGEKLLHDYHVSLRVELAMDKKVCPPLPPLPVEHCLRRRRTTTLTCARLPPSLRTRRSALRRRTKDRRLSGRGESISSSTAAFQCPAPLKPSKTLMGGGSAIAWAKEKW